MSAGDLAGKVMCATNPGDAVVPCIVYRLQAFSGQSGNAVRLIFNEIFSSGKV